MSNSFFSVSDQVNMGIGCASVLNTHRSNGMSSSSVNSKYAYLSLYDR